MGKLPNGYTTCCNGPTRWGIVRLQKDRPIRTARSGVFGGLAMASQHLRLEHLLFTRRVAVDDTDRVAFTANTYCQGAAPGWLGLAWTGGHIPLGLYQGIDNGSAQAIKQSLSSPCPDGETGRRKGLKVRSGQW